MGNHGLLQRGPEKGASHTGCAGEAFLPGALGALKSEIPRLEKLSGRIWSWPVP